jgi:hypothetical protein
MQLGLERINSLRVADFAASPPIRDVESVDCRPAFRADTRERDVDFASAETLQ